MPAPNPYLNTQDDFTDADWKEFVRAWAPATGTFSHHAAQQTLVGYVPEAKERAAIRYFLGYHAISADTTRALLRTPPIAHPKHDNLYCTGVSTAPFKPDAYAQFTGDGRGLKRNRKNTNPAGGRVLPFYGGYKFTQLTLHFEPLAFDLEPDSFSLGGGGAGVSNDNYEWRRYCTWDTEPRLETLSLDGYSLAFAEGSGNTGSTTNPILERFPAEVGKPLVKADLVVKWHMVPADWVETPNRIPHKILKGLGKVNRYTFGGTGASFAAPDGAFLEYPPGTLHFTACKLQRFPNPTYHAGTQSSLTLGRESKTLFDIEFYFSYFNPPKGRTSNATITDNLGHNNFLWRGAVDKATGQLVAGDLNAGKWFCCTYSGSLGSTGSPEARLLDPFNFAMLFDSWQNGMLPDKDG